MYVLLDNSQIKVGPRQYAYSFFQDYLNNKSIDFSLPFDYTQQDTIVINDEIKIVKVQEPTIPSYNPLIEQLAGPYYDLTVEPITGYFNIEPRHLDAIKNELISLVAAKRYEKEMVGFEMTLQNNVVKINTTKEERATWHQMLSVIGDGSIKFKFSSTLWMDLTLIDIQSVVSEIVQYVQDCFIWEANIISQIELAADSSALLTINDEILGVV
jgi:hypothetical protein